MRREPVDLLVAAQLVEETPRPIGVEFLPAGVGTAGDEAVLRAAKVGQVGREALVLDSVILRAHVAPTAPVRFPPPPTASPERRGGAVRAARSGERRVAVVVAVLHPVAHLPHG